MAQEKKDKTGQVKKPAQAKKQAAPKKAAPKKPAAKKAATTKKPAVKKAATTKKTAAKKATAKKPAPAKKAVPKKATAKKPAPKKATAKKPDAKKPPAPKKPVKQATAATPEPADSNYYVIRTIQKITGKYADTMADYNENIKRAVETGMEFVEDVGKGTVEAIGTFVGDGTNLVNRVPGMEKLVSKMDEQDNTGVAEKVKKAVTEPARKAEFMVTTMLLKAAEETATTVRQYNEKYLKKTLEYGSDFVADMGNMANMAMGGLAETGKKFVANLAVLETMETSMQEKTGAFSSRINLPNKNDIKKLTDAMEAFNKKMKDLLAQKQP